MRTDNLETDVLEWPEKPCELHEMARLEMATNSYNNRTRIRTRMAQEVWAKSAVAIEIARGMRNETLGGETLRESAHGYGDHGNIKDHNEPRRNIYA